MTRVTRPDLRRCRCGVSVQVGRVALAKSAGRCLEALVLGGLLLQAGCARSGGGSSEPTGNVKIEVTELGTDVPDLAVPAGLSLTPDGAVEFLLPCHDLGVISLEVTMEPGLEEALETGGDVEIRPVWELQAMDRTAAGFGPRLKLGEAPLGYREVLPLDPEVDLESGRITLWVEYSQTDAGLPISLQGAPYRSLAAGVAFTSEDTTVDETEFLGDESCDLVER